MKTNYCVKSKTGEVWTKESNTQAQLNLVLCILPRLFDNHITKFVKRQILKQVPLPRKVHRRVTSVVMKA